MSQVQTHRKSQTIRLFALSLIVTLCASCLTTSAFAWDQLQPSQLTSGSQIRRAFRSVVSTPRSWTVRVRSNGREASLGAIVEHDGYILTKASQLEGKVTCELSTSERYEAEIIGVDGKLDLALLKIDARDLPTVKWQSVSDPKVGQWVVTPGLSMSPVSVGVLSVTRRNIKPAPGVLGVQIDDAEGGALVKHVMRESGAEEAGLKPGDVILNVAGEDIDSASSLSKFVRKFLPGDRVLVRLLRDEEEINAVVVLTDPQMLIYDRLREMQKKMGGALSRRKTGFSEVLQHDTVLRPEDCGGVIVDLQGKAVGLNIARAGRTKSFAIPANHVIPMIKKLKLKEYAPYDPLKDHKQQTVAADSSSS
ncbi:putative periplasmic serine endoprotease DegP-like precursor [Gimesia panareensis]|uniref:Putative periplasmic serine endoprotease DegP-like n=1 Tax=Gimesia panareensis TaxID=2527978 RepID=A0A518FRR1_9PLAN|nr:PDZ domain-containing protein [Gimesia panareensis]QDV19041.1 putative periplasmic serine endoprotease DegP-like precursor [Gimesia panareensis]